MATIPPSVSATSNLLTTQRALIDTFSSFFTVAIHHVLYLRKIYPPVSFVATRAYNYPVRQNRHPDVCTWINDAVLAVRDQLERNTVENVAICIFECDNNEVLERWTFDLRSFPIVDRRDRDVPFSSIDDTELRKKINVADLEASFRGILSRSSSVSGEMQPLPDGDNAPECSYTVTVQVKEGADAPVGRLSKEERKWIAAEPSPFEDSSEEQTSSSRQITNKGKTGTTYAIRRLEAGELRMEMFVEESDVKLALLNTHKSTLEKVAELSYGAGTEKFNPEIGYDLEEPDINRKPQGGAFTDYQRG